MPVLGTMQEGLHLAIERLNARRDGMVSLCYAMRMCSIMLCESTCVWMYVDCVFEISRLDDRFKRCTGGVYGRAAT